MQYTALESQIEAIIAPSLIAAGYSVVRIKLNQGKQHTLQVMVEQTDSSSATLDECTSLSRTISALLDVEDPIPHEYRLEVSSPGLERPLVKLGDFERFSGKEVKITTYQALEGRKRFKGKLLGVVNNEVTISLVENSDEEDDNQLSIPYENIASANLLITDKTLKEITNKQMSDKEL